MLIINWFAISNIIFTFADITNVALAIINLTNESMLSTRAPFCIHM